MNNFGDSYGEFSNHNHAGNYVDERKSSAESLSQSAEVSLNLDYSALPDADRKAVEDSVLEILRALDDHVTLLSIIRDAHWKIADQQEHDPETGIYNAADTR